MNECLFFAGFEKDVGSATSKTYNANVRRMVAHISMLEYLKHPPEGFEEIIKTHFRLKARYLRKQLDKWLEEDDGKQLYADSMSATRTYQPTTGPFAGTTTTIAATIANASANATGFDGASAGDVAGNVNASSGKATSSKATTAFAKDIEEIKKLLDKLEMEE